MLEINKLEQNKKEKFANKDSHEKEVKCPLGNLQKTKFGEDAE